jgi:hypothetical protein
VAADDLPMPVVNFLNVIGIKWPYINEDTIHQFAALVREFGQAVEQTHQDAANAVEAVARAHQSSSTQQLESGWAELSSTHVTEILDGTKIVADALDAWAVYIVGQKAMAVVQLIEMATEFLADQAASIATFGLAEAALPAIILAGQKIGQSLIADLEQYVIGQVMEAALKPFLAKVESMLTGLDWANTTKTVSGPGASMSLDAAEARAQIALLRQHALTMASHAQTLKSGLEGLSF